MKTSVPLVILQGVASISLLALAGCTANPSQPRLNIYGQITLPPESKKVGLAITRPCPGFNLQTPLSRSEAARNTAVLGAREVASDPYAGLLIPVGFVMGGLVGGLSGVGDHELKTAVPSIEAVAKDFCLAAKLAQSIQQQVNASQPGRILHVRSGMISDSRSQSGHLARDPDGRLTWARFSHPQLPPDRKQVDTLIGVHVQFQGFSSRPNPHLTISGDAHELNPPLRLELIADVQITRLRDRELIGGLTIHYEGTTRKFKEWADNGASSLKSELAAATEQITAEVRQRISGRSSLPAQLTLSAATGESNAGPLPDPEPASFPSA